MNPKQEKKIREIIERSLSDSDEFTIKFEDETLSIEPSKQSIFHHIGFIALIIIPVIAILRRDISAYSFAVAIFYSAALSYRYYDSLRYQVYTIFKYKERVLLYKNIAFSNFFNVGSRIIKFENLGSVESRSVGWRTRGVRVAFRSRSKSVFPILEVVDEFKAKRIKFILTEIVK
ncbi:MAG: hypothetical protein ACI905_000591 [Roseivirga sp.]|jgi:hypothetical protein